MFSVEGNVMEGCSHKVIRCILFVYICKILIFSIKISDFNALVCCESDNRINVRTNLYYFAIKIVSIAALYNSLEIFKILVGICKASFTFSCSFQHYCPKPVV